jgi:hypothetical protein
LLPAKSPGLAAPSVTSPLTFSPIEELKAGVDDIWDDVCLDVDFVDFKPDTRRSIQAKAYR